MPDYPQPAICPSEMCDHIQHSYHKLPVTLNTLCPHDSIYLVENFENPHSK